MKAERDLEVAARNDGVRQTEHYEAIASERSINMAPM